MTGGDFMSDLFNKLAMRRKGAVFTRWTKGLTFVEEMKRKDPNLNVFKEFLQRV